MPTIKLWTRAETRPVDFETSWPRGIDEDGPGVRYAHLIHPETTHRQARGTFRLSRVWMAKGWDFSLHC